MPAPKKYELKIHLTEIRTSDDGYWTLSAWKQTDYDCTTSLILEDFALGISGGVAYMPEYVNASEMESESYHIFGAAPTSIGLLLFW
ncbi:MAG: hypothetical protein LBR66_04035, partial [Candidatus Symbiothrix sp.]|nr:hypothetical protein [Candidatus Symbiothrix sp.]